jgi:hypothetical protein
MYRREGPLEAWERNALRAYALREEGGAARRIAAALEAERLTRRAHALARGGLRTARPSAYRLRAAGNFLSAEALCAASRMEYRLYALFAE